MDDAATLQTILARDPLRWQALGLVASLGLPDCWIGSGFIRSAVWDHLHHRPPAPPGGDVDVLWFDPDHPDPAADKRHEAALRRLDPTLDWSVKNQARMHARNADAPYTGTIDAMRHWPETATAVAARRRGPRTCQIAAPFGLEDLFNLVVRPTARFTGAKHSLYLDRIRTKHWAATWPHLQIDTAAHP